MTRLRQGGIESRANRSRFAHGCRCLAVGLAFAWLSATGAEQARAAAGDCGAAADSAFLDRNADQYIYPRDGIAAQHKLGKRERLAKRWTGPGGIGLLPEPTGAPRTIVFAVPASFDTATPVRPFPRGERRSRAPPRAS